MRAERSAVTENENENENETRDMGDSRLDHRQINVLYAATRQGVIAAGRQAVLPALA